jgi:hypothetical protein
MVLGQQTRIREDSVLNVRKRCANSVSTDNDFPFIVPLFSPFRSISPLLLRHGTPDYRFKLKFHCLSRSRLEKLDKFRETVHKYDLSICCF